MSNDSTTTMNASEPAASPENDALPARAPSRKAAQKRKATSNTEVVAIAMNESTATRRTTRQIAFSEFDEWGLPVDRDLLD